MIVKKLQLQYTKNQYLLSGIFSTLSNRTVKARTLKRIFKILLVEIF